MCSEIFVEFSYIVTEIWGYNLWQNYWDSFMFCGTLAPFLPSSLKEKVSPIRFPYSMLFCFMKPTCVILLLPEIILGKGIRENGHSFGNGFHLSHFYRKTGKFLLCASTGFFQGCNMVIKLEVFENNIIINPRKSCNVQNHQKIS